MVRDEFNIFERVGALKIATVYDIVVIPRRV